MKKLLGLLIVLALFTGCGSSNKASTTSAQAATQTQPATKNNVSNEVVLKALGNVTMHIDGIYYQYDKDGKAHEFKPNHKTEYDAKFTGSLQNVEITSISDINASNQFTVAFNATIGNEFYKTEKPHSMSVSCTKNGNDLTLSDPTFTDSEPLFTVAMIPFNTDFLYENNDGIRYDIKGKPNQYGQYDPTETKHLTLDFTKDTVKSIELYNYGIKSEFLISADLRITLADGTKLTNLVNLEYKPNSGQPDSKQWSVKYYQDKYFIE